MHLKRTLSLILAIMMVFYISPPSYGTSGGSKTTTQKKLVLEYKDTTRVATIIRGSTINVKAINTQNYGLRISEPLKVTDGKNVDSKSEFNVRVIDDKDPDHEFLVEAKKPAEGSPYPPRNQYVIQSNYNSMQKVASAYCPTLGGFSGTLEATGEPLAIIRNSVATLSYDGSSFKLLDVRDNDAAGIFKNWSETVTVKSVSGGTDRDPLVYNLHFKNDNSQDYFFNFYPNQRHRFFTDHDNNPATDPVWDGRTYTYELKPSVYTIQFVYEESNQLMLTVEHPLNVLEDVVSRATNTNQGKTSDFVKMKGTDDDFQYITDNMELRGIYEMYGEKLDLKWEWLPADSADADVIKITGPSEWKSVSVQRKRQDVKGKLKVTATYRTPGFYTPPAEVSGTIDVLIYGRGISANVTQRSQIIGQNPESAFAADHIKLPSNKKMDLYKGDVENFTLPVNPHVYTLLADFGEENGYAHSMTIKSSNPAVLTASIEQGDQTSPYTFGTSYTNKETATLIPTSANIVLNAASVGTTKLEFQFFIKGNNNKLVEDIAARKTILIEVEDTSPSDDSTLESLSIKQPGKDLIEYGFSPNTGEYSINLGYDVSEIVVKPVRKDPNASEKIKLRVFKKNDNGIFVEDSTYSVDLKSGSYSSPVALVINNPTRILLTVTAENPNITKTYQLNIMRNPPSTESGLKTLELFDVGGKNQLTSFNSKTDEYFITVPFSVKILRPQFTTLHGGAKATVEKPELVTMQSGLAGLFQKKEWVPLAYQATEGGFIDTTTIEILSRSESDLVNLPPTPTDSTLYKIHVTRSTPSAVATMDGLDVFDMSDKKITYQPSFKKDIYLYDLAIPYTTGKLVLQPKITDKYATAAIYDKEGNKLADVPNGSRSPRIDIPYITDTMPYYDLILRVTAENETTTQDYVLRVIREAPNDNALLKSLIVKDQDNKNVDIEFFQENFNYYKQVPYETAKVTLTPTAVFDSIESIKINNRKVENGKQSFEVKLNYPDATEITVEVMAQNGRDKQVYTISLTRLPPSSDARLKGLVLSNATEFKPLFNAGKTEYTAVVQDGAKGINVTATANHAGARISLNGNKIESGVASELIEFIEVDSTLKIVVTAQDGKTTMTYTVKIKNPNLIQKSSNADLRSLTINYGEITPSFKPSISAYDVAVRDDVYSVDIMARPADSLAQVKIFAGTKEIGDENGNFSEAIYEGENSFTVHVTSPDKTKTKKYNVNVYKNEEDKMGVLTPITADQVDFKSSDLIIIDISKYSRISAEVFNTLKKYPQKRMILLGNDYSLEFAAADIKKVIPNTTIYDFGLRFTSPEEDRVFDLLYHDTGNHYYEDVTIVYFNHHGELPAPAKFTLSLGDMYKSRVLYWNYYNTERDRIDYYGYVNTNTKGTFSLQLTHLSTYMTTTNKIKNAENKATGNGYIGYPSSGKANPSTGAVAE